MGSYLGHILIREGIISVNQLRAAIKEQKRTGRRLYRVLIDLGYASEQQLVDFLSKEYCFPIINLDEFEVDPVALNLIPKRIALRHNLVPINHLGSTLFVAMSDPSDLVTVDDLRFATGCDIKPVIAPEQAIKNTIEKYYSTENRLDEQKAEENSISEVEAKREDRESNAARSKWVEFIRQVEKSSHEARREREIVAVRSYAVPSPQDSNIAREKEELCPQASQEGEKEETLDLLSLFYRGEVEQQKEEGINHPTEQKEEIIGPSASTSQDVDSTAGEWESSRAWDEEESFKPDSLFYYATYIKIQEDVGPEVKKEDEKTLELSFASEEGKATYKEDGKLAFKARLETRQEECGFEPYSFSFYSTDVPEQEEKVASNAKMEEELELSAVSSQERVSLKKEKEMDFESPQDKGIESFNLPSYGGEPVREQERTVLEIEQKSVEASESGGFNFLEYESPCEFDSGETERGEPFKPNDHLSQKGDAPPPLIDRHSIQENVVVHKENAFSPYPEPREKEAKVPSDQGAILVIDDSPTIQKIVSITLERQGYRILIASDGMQALARFNEVVPDLIFLDIELPHMDGYQVCKVIKGNGLTKDVPVIMLFERDRFFDRVRGCMAGATNYITKPFQPATLLQAVEKHCRKRGAKQLHLKDKHTKSAPFSVEDIRVSDGKRGKSGLLAQDGEVLSQSEIEQSVVLQDRLILVLSKLEQLMVRLEKAYKQPILAIQLLSEIVNRVVEFSETVHGDDTETIHIAKALTRERDKYPMLQLLHTLENRVSVQTAMNLFNGWAGDQRDRKEIFSKICQGMISILESYCSLLSTFFRSSRMCDEWRGAYGVFLFDLKQVMNKIQF